MLDDMGTDNKPMLMEHWLKGVSYSLLFSDRGPIRVLDPTKVELLRRRLEWVNMPPP